MYSSTIKRLLLPTVLLLPLLLVLGPPLRYTLAGLHPDAWEVHP